MGAFNLDLYEEEEYYDYLCFYSTLLAYENSSESEARQGEKLLSTPTGPKSPWTASLCGDYSKTYLSGRHGVAMTMRYVVY